MSNKFKINLTLLLVWWLILPLAEAFALFEWTNQPFFSGGTLLNQFPCMEVPENSSFENGTQALDLTKSGQWMPTGSYVKEGKMIQFDWSTRGLQANPRKYLVMYRVDPRFPEPQLFIQTYNYKTGKYSSDFNSLLKYQTDPALEFAQRIIDYTSYFSFSSRPKIPVYQGDVVNITLGSMAEFFAANSDFSNELDSNELFLTLIYTVSGIDNKMIYSSAGAWCSAITSGNPTPTSVVCSNNTYKNTSDLLGPAVGKINEPSFNALKNSLPSCPAISNTKELNSLCSYDKGRGMKISVGGKVIKKEEISFIHSAYTNADFLYYEADASGNLDITSSWQIAGMFVNFPQFMSDWQKYGQLANLMQFVNSSETNLALNFLHFGRYVLIVEIGSGIDSASFEEQKAIKVEYTITGDSAAPSSTDSGMQVAQHFTTNAERNGYLWLRVINPNDQVQGSINVNYSNYTGSTWFSTTIADKIVTPLRNEFKKLTESFYNSLIKNQSLQGIYRLLLTIYVVLYGIFYLAGATKVTLTDIIIRVVKISLVVELFSPTSWQFFNDNLFNAFVDGSDYLMGKVVGASSSTTNIFGFVDPIFDKYTNPRIWSLLLTQLMQIHNGVAIFAVMTIYAILIYFRAVLEVIIGYVIAFVGLSVMIGLAPFFLTFMLFEQTKSLFNNWFSTLFNYMVQPTILMVFFLLIEQIMSAQISKALVRACWDTLIPIQISLDLNHIGIPMSFSFALPFLPGIPFYVPSLDEPTNINSLMATGSIFAVATSSLLFYSYCKMSYGLVDYVTIVISQLTNVMPARKEGDFQKPVNPTEDIINDISKFTIDPLKEAGQKIKEKVIDQKYHARREGSQKSYGNKIFAGSRQDIKKNEDNTDK